MAHPAYSRLISAARTLGALALFTGFAGARADVSVRRGEIADSIACVAAPAQRYALYLPPAYTTERKWPVIFCFDPGARGRVPVERLKLAAERYGYVLAGSLNSRNGNWDASMAAANAMLHDVASRVAIDPKRLYVAGFSGGARVATGVALSGIARGVIACGAGFPGDVEQLAEQSRFAFFGIAGTEDFNHQELLDLDEQLDVARVAHHIRFFDGPHDWPAPELLVEAVEWLELQAMREGTRPRDDGFVSRQRDVRATKLAELTGAALWRATKALADDFRTLTDIARWDAEAKQLIRSRAVKAELKAERDRFNRELKLIDTIRREARQHDAAKRRAFAEDLRNKADAPDRTDERQMVRRAIAKHLYDTREEVTELLRAQKAAEAVSQLEFATALRPSDSRLLSQLARARALAGDAEGALRDLETWADTAARTASFNAADSAWDRLRSDPRFAQISARFGPVR